MEKYTWRGLKSEILIDTSLINSDITSSRY